MTAEDRPGKSNNAALETSTAEQARSDIWVLAGIQNWPIIGPIIRRDVEKFLRSQGSQPGKPKE